MVRDRPYSVPQVGRSGFFEGYYAPICDERGQVVGGLSVVRDVTEQKLLRDELERSREELRELATHLQEMTERERKALAREVHDELGQALTALKMDLSWIHRSVPEATPGLARRLASMEEVIDDTVGRVRRIATELRPALLDRLGVVAAIEWQAEQFQRRMGIRCTARVPDSVVADEAVGLCLFRCLQEALTNVARHAQATRVEIEVSEDENGVRLGVSDNGCGISEEALRKLGSFGILGMRERIRALGGGLEVQRRDAGGTSVEVVIPVTPTGGA